MMGKLKLISEEEEYVYYGGKKHEVLSLYKHPKREMNILLLRDLESKKKVVVGSELTVRLSNPFGITNYTNEYFELPNVIAREVKREWNKRNFFHLKRNKRIISLVVAGLTILLLCNIHPTKKLIFNIFDPYYDEPITYTIEDSSVRDCIEKLEDNNTIVCPDFLKNQIIPFLEEVEKKYQYIPNIEKTLPDFEAYIVDYQEFYEKSKVGEGCYIDGKLYILNKEALKQRFSQFSDEEIDEFITYIFGHEVWHHIQQGGLFTHNRDCVHGSDEGLVSLQYQDIVRKRTKFNSNIAEQHVMRAFQQLIGPELDNAGFTSDTKKYIELLAELYGDKNKALQIIKDIDCYTSFREGRTPEIYRQGGALDYILFPDIDYYKLRENIVSELCEAVEIKMKKDIDKDLYSRNEQDVEDFLIRIQYYSKIIKNTFKYEDCQTETMIQRVNKMKDFLYAEFCLKHNLDVNKLKGIENLYENAIQDDLLDSDEVIYNRLLIYKETKNSN